MKFLHSTGSTRLSRGRFLAAGPRFRSAIHRVGVQHVLLALGVAARLTRYLRQDSYHLDEAKLGLALFWRPIGRVIAAPLDYEQVAGFGYRILARTSAEVLGVSELGVRLVSFIASVITLLFVERLTRCLQRDVRLLAIALVALNPFLIEYAAMMKPYSMDAMFAASLPSAALSLFHANDNAKLKSFRVFALTTLCGCAVSVPSTFVVAGILVAALVYRSEAITHIGRTRWILLAIACLVLSLMNVGINSDPAVARMMQIGWRYGFVSFEDFPLRFALFGGTLSTLTLAAVDRASDTMHFAGYLYVVAAVVLAIGGLVLLARNGFRQLSILLAVPALCLGLSSAFRVYPFSTRTALFLAPGLSIATAASLSALGATLKRLPYALPWVHWLALTPALFHSLQYDLRESHPSLRDQISTMRCGLANRDAIYVSSRISQPWLMYTVDWGAPDKALLSRLSRLLGVRGPAFENRESRGGPVRPEEGSGLAYHLEGHPVVLGLPVGSPLDNFMVRRELNVDDGFIGVELGRIRAQDPNRVWLLDSELEEIRTLRATFWVTGWRRVLTEVGGTSKLELWQRE